MLTSTAITFLLQHQSNDAFVEHSRFWDNEATHVCLVLALLLTLLRRNQADPDILKHHEGRRTRCFIASCVMRLLCYELCNEYGIPLDRCIQPFHRDSFR